MPSTSNTFATLHSKDGQWERVPADAAEDVRMRAAGWTERKPARRTTAKKTAAGKGRGTSSAGTAEGTPSDAGAGAGEGTT